MKTNQKCSDCGYILDEHQESCHMCGCLCLESLSKTACPKCGEEREVEDLGDDDCPKPCLICMKCDLVERVRR